MNLPALRRRHLLAYIVVSCALAVACLNVVPGGSLGAVVVQTAAAGAAVIVVLALFDPAALKSRHPVPRNARGAFLMCAGVLAIGLAAGLATVGLAGAGVGIKPPGSADIALFLILCLLTGVFEEALFRGALFRSFAEALEGAGTRRPLLVAAAASAAIFGILHVSGAAAPPADAVSLVQLAGKPVQAALFGVIMAGVYAQSGNLWLVSGAHAAFSALSELPSFATSGLLVETYVTGSPADLAVLLGTIALFVPLAAVAARGLARAGRLA